MSSCRGGRLRPSRRAGEAWPGSPLDFCPISPENPRCRPLVAGFDHFVVDSGSRPDIEIVPGCLPVLALNFASTYTTHYLPALQGKERI